MRLIELYRVQNTFEFLSRRKYMEELHLKVETIALIKIELNFDN